MRRSRCQKQYCTHPVSPMSGDNVFNGQMARSSGGLGAPAAVLKLLRKLQLLRAFEGHEAEDALHEHKPQQRRHVVSRMAIPAPSRKGIP